MSNFETVEGSIKALDPILQKQKEGVARMRTSLLACADNPTNIHQALKNINGLRVYHQMMRIIRYIEIMDKVEAKMYESIEATLDNMNTNSTGTWILLSNLQEKLQRSMIESHKLLQPYLEMQKENDTFVDPEVDINSEEILTLESRERIRSAAKALLAELGVSEDDDE